MRWIGAVALLFLVPQTAHAQDCTNAWNIIGQPCQQLYPQPDPGQQYLDELNAQHQLDVQRQAIYELQQQQEQALFEEMQRSSQVPLQDDPFVDVYGQPAP